MNLEIKERPEFQPFCPSILLDEQERLFDKSYFNKASIESFHSNYQCATRGMNNVESFKTSNSCSI